MPIEGLSEKRRLPRLGKIRLGIKVKKTCTVCGGRKVINGEKCSKCRGEGFVTYPKEEDYFICSQKVQEVFGEKPKELKIMFPVENEEIFFSQFYRCYGFNYLKCKGNGIEAWTFDEETGGLKTIVCPCEKLKKNECKQTGFLQVLLPDVSGAGVWQINTSSKNSIIDINSGIDYIRSICKRISMIPLILKRVPMDTQRIEKGQLKSGKHYTLQLDLDNVSLRQLQEAAQIPPEKALIPPVDEEKDELLYPAQGFMAEEEANETKEEMKKEEAVVGEGAFDKAKETLKDRMDDYVKKWGGVISMGTAEKVAKFTTFEQVSKEMDRIETAIEAKKAKAKKKEKEFAGSEGELPF